MMNSRHTGVETNIKEEEEIAIERGFEGEER